MERVRTLRLPVADPILKIYCTMISNLLLIVLSSITRSNGFKLKCNLILNVACYYILSATKFLYYDHCQ